MCNKTGGRASEAGVRLSTVTPREPQVSHFLPHPTNKTPQQEPGVQAPPSSTEKSANCQLPAKTDVTQIAQSQPR